MTILWIDGFDHYGTESDMRDGAYAQVADAFAGGLSTGNPRTGAKCYEIGNNASSYLRRTLLDDKEVAGIGYAFNMTTLPTNNDRMVLAQFRDNANNAQVSIAVTTTGQVQLRRGGVDPSPGVLLATSGQVILPDAYQHFETRVKIHDTLGACEVRINGVTVLDVSDVDTKNTSELSAAQVVIGMPTEFGNGAGMLIDDLFAWDDQGSFNNDFIGDRRVQTLYPDDDTTVTDWDRNTGSTDFENIDDATPDDDTGYLFAETLVGSPPVAAVSEFGIEDLPADVSQVSAVMMVTRVRKTEAGECDFQASLLSDDTASPPVTSAADGADRPITEQYTYYHDVVEADPVTGAPWTLAAFNAAKLRIARTS